MTALTNVIKITYRNFCNSGVLVTSCCRKSCNDRGARSEKNLALYPIVHLHTGCLNRVVAKALYRVRLFFSGVIANSYNDVGIIIEQTGPGVA
jgi:hypothetical protein